MQARVEGGSSAGGGGGKPRQHSEQQLTLRRAPGLERNVLLLGRGGRAAQRAHLRAWVVGRPRVSWLLLPLLRRRAGVLLLLLG